MKQPKKAPITLETQMDPVLRIWLNDRGWAIVGELALGGIKQRPDLAGVKQGEDGAQRTLILEITSKPYVDRRHWKQAIKWREFSPEVAIAVLTAEIDGWQASQDGSLDSKLAAALGVSLLAVCQYSGAVVALPRVEAALSAGKPAEILLDAIGSYRAAGVDPVGGQPGNAGISERKIRADRVHAYLLEASEVSGRAFYRPIGIFASWFGNRQNEGIKAELKQDGRFKFTKRKGMIQIRLADEIEEIEE